MAHDVEKCKKCGSENVIFSKKKQFFICEDCSHEFTIQNEFIPKRVFISYGRDGYSSLAERIKDDLKAHGHEVWFDKDRLKEGGDWESYINDGLNWASEDPASGRIVFIMTPHSVRRPDGYCLNEIAKALTKSVAIVPVMLVFCEPPLSIYRLQYLDMQGCFPPEEKLVTYEKRLERLILALEENKLDFEGVQSRLLKALEPISFAADISKLLKDFTGRRWVFEEVDRWLQDTEGDKIFWITGAPGIGKSAISAWVRDNRREIAAFHFCDIYSEEKRDPCKLVRSVAYQLSTQLPAYEERLKGLALEETVREYHEAYTLFDKLIVQPLSENFPQPDRTVVVLIDALDEATYQKRNEIALFLSRCTDKTPPWLRFLVTSRPEPEIRSALQSLSPYVLDTSTENNSLDITNYLKKKLPQITGEQIEALLEKSEGTFLYVRYVCDEIQLNRLSLERLDQFPQGLGDVYLQYFDRQFGKDMTFYENQIRPLLCIILASFEPLELGFLMRALGYKNRMELFDRIDRLGSLFPRTGEKDTDTIASFHRSVTDWITAKDKSGSFYIDAFYGHELLAGHGWSQYEQATEKMDRYSLQWLPAHLAQINAHEKLLRLLKNFNYMMARLRAGMLERLLEDYRETIKTMPSEHRQYLRIEEAFFRERAHILRRDDKDWPAYKILLQLAIEHADDSPVTQEAERYIAGDKCDWVWLRREQRVICAGVDPCVAVLEGHTSCVNGALKLSDGRILSWSNDKTLRLWSREGQPLAVMEGHKDYVKGALELVDNRILSWSGDSFLRLWGREGQLVAVLEGHTKLVDAALELGDGRILSREQSILRLWNKEGQPLAVLEGHTASINGVIELGDGRILSWGGNNPRLWNKVGQPLSVMQGHAEWVIGVIELGDGRILSWSWDGTLRLWDREGQSLSILKGHENRVFGAIELGDGRILSWSKDSTLRLWGREGQSLSVLQTRVNGAFELDDGRILSWSGDNTLRLWGREGHPLITLYGHTERVIGSVDVGDGRILSWSGDSTLRLWNSEGHPLSVLEGHTDSVRDAVELSDGRIFSWGGPTLRLWTHAGQPLNVLEGDVNGVLELSNGRILSRGRWKNSILQLWDRNGQPLAAMEGHTASINSVIELGDGRILSWANDNTLRLWDSEGRPLNTLVGHTEMVNGALELSDGSILSWSYDKTLRLWNREGQPLAVSEGHTYYVKGAMELRDGRILSWGKWDDHTLRLWSRAGRPLNVLEGHKRDVDGVLELSNGRILSWADTLRLWDRDGRPLNVLKGKEAIELGDGRILSFTGWSRTNMDGGTVELDDGRIFSWSQENNSVCLFKQDGEPLTKHYGLEGLRLYPEVLKAILGEELATSRSWLGTVNNTSFLRTVGNYHETSVVWHAASKCSPRLLKADGRAVVTQDNGQVCFLMAYHGDKRITLDELEQMVTT